MASRRAELLRTIASACLELAALEEGAEGEPANDAAPPPPSAPRRPRARPVPPSPPRPATEPDEVTRARARQALAKLPGYRPRRNPA